METNVLERFYTAFNNVNAEEMVACYHPDIVFHDPAFGTLKGQRAANMWRMLCKSQEGKVFKVVFSELIENEKRGTIKWEAFYEFSKTGRKVHNIIHAEFEFEQGLIIKHTDHFNLHKWAAQALGFKGRVLGNTNFFRKKIQGQTNRLLDKFEAELEK